MFIITLLAYNNNLLLLLFSQETMKYPELEQHLSKNKSFWVKYRHNEPRLTTLH